MRLLLDAGADKEATDKVRIILIIIIVVNIFLIIIIIFLSHHVCNGDILVSIVCNVQLYASLSASASSLLYM